MSYQYKYIKGLEKVGSLSHLFGKTRVEHDSRQIKEPSQFEVGGLYRRMTKSGNGTSSEFKFLEFVRNKERFIEVIVNPNSEKPYKDKISLADSGIIPYENGEWHQDAYVIPANS